MRQVYKKISPGKRIIVPEEDKKNCKVKRKSDDETRRSPPVRHKSFAQKIYRYEL